MKDPDSGRHPEGTMNVGIQGNNLIFLYVTLGGELDQE